MVYLDDDAKNFVALIGLERHQLNNELLEKVDPVTITTARTVSPDRGHGERGGTESEKGKKEG